MGTKDTKGSEGEAIDPKYLAKENEVSMAMLMRQNELQLKKIQQLEQEQQQLDADSLIKLIAT